MPDMIKYRLTGAVVSTLSDQCFMIPEDATAITIAELQTGYRIIRYLVPVKVEENKPDG